MPGWLPPTGPRNPSMQYTGGGAQSTVPGYPTMQGGGGTDAMINALLSAPQGRSRQADALEAAPRAAAPPPRQTSAPNPESLRGDPYEARMKQLQLENAQIDLAKKKKEGEVWLKEGIYGPMKVSPGSPGAYLSQSSGY